MQPVSINVAIPLEKLKEIIVTDGLKNSFQVSHTKVIKWSENSPNHIVGKISYFRRKKLSTFRFHMNLESIASGTQVLISVEPTSFFFKNKWILYLLGLLMCGVGIIFPLVGLNMLEQRVNSIITDISNAILVWDNHKYF